jgi:hypothetical protein
MILTFTQGEICKIVVLPYAYSYYNNSYYYTSTEKYSIPHTTGKALTPTLSFLTALKIPYQVYEDYTDINKFLLDYPEYLL